MARRQLTDSVPGDAPREERPLAPRLTASSAVDVGAVLRLQRSAGNAVTAALLRTRHGPAMVQRSSLAELSGRVSAGAHDQRAIEALEQVTEAELELLHVDDLRALWRSTNALVASIEASEMNAPEATWVGYARGFVTKKLKPVIAAKVQQGEVATLFWPLVEHVKQTLPDGRLKSAFLKVLPDTKRYVSAMLGNAPAPGARSSKELERIGVQGAGFSRKLSECAAANRIPGHDELVLTFVDVPAVVAEQMHAVVAKDVSDAFMSLPDAGDAAMAQLLSHAGARVKRLGAALNRKLLDNDADWSAVHDQFQERIGIDIGGAARAEKYALAAVRRLASDPETVTSCYWSPDEAEATRFDPESTHELFERALAKLTEERAGGEDPSPLSWPTWEARLSGGDWVEVEIAAERDGRYRVHPLGLTTEYDEEVERDDLRPRSRWSKGDEVMVEWDQTLFPGRVLEVDGTWVRVHWHGYPESAQGGWIRADRLQAAGA